VALSDQSLLQHIQDVIDRAQQDEGSWLIIVFHRVDEDGNIISVRHELIAQTIAYLQQKNAQVVTHTEAEKILGIK
jgi:hypothetical protein